MKPQPYSKQVGDLEIRIRPDGTLVFVAPDQDLMELAETLQKNQQQTTQATEKDNDGGTDKQSHAPGAGQ